MEQLMNETRYELYKRRGILQAHLEIVETAIQQHNRHFEDNVNLCNRDFRNSDTATFERSLRDIAAG
jgi:hypothetical protein